MAGSSLLPYLRLIRLPNVFTAMADILAGYFIVVAQGVQWSDLGWLMLASACIYGGGCALNDVCDLELDQTERPGRPIPSGAVSRRAALLFSLVLLGVGLGAAVLAGRQAFWLAGLLVGLVVSYDCVLKDVPFWGSLNMAACRGGNLLLGMIPALQAGPLLFLPLISMSYVFWLTALSKFETAGTPRQYVVIIPLGLLATALLPICLVVTGPLSAQALIALGLLGLMTAPPVIAWLRRPCPELAGRAVKFLVLGIPLLDAVYVVGLQGWALALPVYLCLVLAVGCATVMMVN